MRFQALVGTHAVCGACRYLEHIDSGYYRGNAYHNALHAASVVWCVPARGGTLRAVRAFVVGFLPCVWDPRSASTRDMQYYLKAGNLGAVLTFTQRFAALLAAAVHDFRHPALNNLCVAGGCLAIALFL